MLSCIGIEWKPLTWLRYTTWIPLYPLGGLAEGMSKKDSLINNKVKVVQIIFFLAAGLKTNRLEQQINRHVL